MKEEWANLQVLIKQKALKTLCKKEEIEKALRICTPKVADATNESRKHGK